MELTPQTAPGSGVAFRPQPQGQGDGGLLGDRETCSDVLTSGTSPIPGPSLSYGTELSPRQMQSKGIPGL